MTTNAFCGSIVRKLYNSKYVECKTMLIIPKIYYVGLEKNKQKVFKSQTSKIIDKCKAHNCPPSDMELINDIIREFIQEERNVNQQLIPTA